MIKLNSKLIAYVDGSYSPTDNRFSFGCLLILPDGNKIEMCQAFDDEEMAKMRNVSGEIVGATQAMLYAYNNGFKELDLYYDYMGIEKWCTREWSANKVNTQRYAAFYSSIKNTVKVNFHKVKGHSGDQYNDVADKLAKQALGL